jgi:hypothetical protein
MASLKPEQLDDLVNLTFNRARKKSWVDLSLDNQEYVFAQQFMNGKNKTPVKGGPQQTWKIQVNNTGNSRFTGLFSKDQTAVTNLTIGAVQNWAIHTSSFSYDVNEPEFQGDDVTQIVDEIKVREHSMYNDFFESMESSLWTAPTSSTQDPRPLSGIPFWIQKNATEGFNGGNPSGFSDGAGGVNTTTYSKWKNYTFAYTAVERDDLVAKWIKACEFTNFKAPHAYPELGGGKASWMFYTTFRLVEPLMQYLDARNDNIKDVAGTARVTFKGIPVMTAWELENSTQDGYDSADPIYGINWKSFEFFFQKGKEMERKKPLQAPGQHNVRNVFMDSICNMLCYNRRQNFVGYVA